MSNDNNPTNPNGHSDICDRLRFLREKYFGQRGKRKFATALGLPLSTYATYEAGRTPPPEILVTVSRITGCSLDWLMTGKPLAGPGGIADQEVSEILTRMEKLISSRPQARQAVTALLDLLTVQPAATAKDSPIASPVMRDKVIPILGRAAAGLPAYWEADDNEYADIAALANSFQPNDIKKRIATEMIDPTIQRAAGQAEIIHLTNPIALSAGQIDGLIVANGLKGQGKLFAVSIVGDSMSPRLLAGDYVIVDSGQPAENAGICLTELRDRIGAICKIYYPEESQIRLSSLNTAYDPIVVARSQIKWAFKVVAAIKQ